MPAIGESRCRGHKSSVCIFCGFYVISELFQKHKVLKPKLAKMLLYSSIYRQIPGFYAAGHSLDRLLGVICNQR